MVKGWGEGALTRRRQFMKMGAVTFNDVLESIETFSEDEAESLLEIIEKRLIEEKRERLARSIKAARKELAGGKVKSGTVDDLIKTLSFASCTEVALCE